MKPVFLFSFFVVMPLAVPSLAGQEKELLGPPGKKELDKKAEPASKVELAKKDEDKGKLPLTKLYPSRLMPDLCLLKYRVTTRSPVCQAYFDQGLGFLYSYVWM